MGFWFILIRSGIRPNKVESWHDGQMGAIEGVAPEVGVIGGF
jgi:hypothetical protein